MSRRIEKCRACAGTGQIIVDNWLTEGMSPEELAKEKAEAIRTAEIELRNKQIKELEKMGYRKASEVAEEIFAEIGKRLDALLKMAPGGGEYTSAKTFLDAHWEFIANSIISKYTESEKEE